MVSQQEDKDDFARAMDEDRIPLLILPIGPLGVEFVQVDTGRGSEDHTCRVYDRTWSRMVYPFRQSPADPSQKPRLLAEMIRLAEILAAGWDFVRIDLYSPSHERILFGEITFTPSAGWQKFTDKAFDTEIGSAWHLT